MVSVLNFLSIAISQSNEYSSATADSTDRQNVGQILDSKGNLISFCHEVQRMLGMEYRAPPLPVDLTGGRLDEDGKLTLDAYRDKEDRSTERNQFLDTESKTDLFRSVAQQRHQLSARFS